MFPDSSLPCAIQEQAFVHYEIVPSGNRLIVTSRPEGVDVNDYKTRFVVMNLCDLSQA